MDTTSTTTMSADSHMSLLTSPACGLLDMPDEVISMMVKYAVESASEEHRETFAKGLKIVLCMTCKGLFDSVYTRDLDARFTRHDLEMYGIWCDKVEMIFNPTETHGTKRFNHHVIAPKTALQYGSMNIITYMGVHIDGDAIAIAAKYGRLNLIQPNVGNLTSFHVETAAEHGQIPILEWMLAAGHIKWTPNIARFAANNGLRTLQWVVDRGCMHTPIVLYDMVLHGDLAGVEYCKELGHTIPQAFNGSPNRYYGIALRGHLAMMKLLYSEGFTNVPPYVSEHAAKLGRRDILDWLREVNSLDVKSAIAGAISAGNVPLLRDLLDEFPAENNLVIDYDRPNSLFVAGHLQMIEFLWSCGKSFNHSNVIAAAENDHWDVVRWALGMTTSDHARMIRGRCAKIAAGCGNIAFLQYVVACGQPLTASMCTAAAKHGRNTAIKWLRSAGCPWDERATEKAARHARHRTFRLLIEWDCPFNSYRIYRKCKSKWFQDWVIACGHPRELTVVSPAGK